MQIRIDDLGGPEIADLLRAHLAFCRATSPPESTHALDLDGLRVPAVTFWSAWEGPDLIGCGALKEIDPAHGEIKSMHTAAKQRGRGVGIAILKHIVAEARRMGFTRMSLETGSDDHFEPARRLYEKFEFGYCEPFADYTLDPHSVYMTRTL